MDGQLKITPKDLKRFHLNHFGSTPPHSAIIGTTLETGLHEVPRVRDLGTYPDGVARTLTDDEIAWFRAAELRKLEIKNEEEQLRRLKQSNDEKLGADQVSTVEVLANAPLVVENKQAVYDSLFGSFSNYQQNLDQYNDEDFLAQCRKLRVVSYYPAAPLRLS